jgi:hypothetical protein
MKKRTQDRYNFSVLRGYSANSAHARELVQKTGGLQPWRAGYHREIYGCIFVQLKLGKPSVQAGSRRIE